MPEILNVHISMTSLQYASRVQKELLTLESSQKFDKLIAFGFDKVHSIQEISDKCEMYRVGIGFLDFLRITSYPIKYIFYCLKIFQLCKDYDVKYIHVHAALALPIAYALRLIHRSKIVYVPHELESKRVGKSRIFKFIVKTIEKVFVPTCHAGYTVSDEISQWYNRELSGFEFKTVYNLPKKQKIVEKPFEVSLKAELGLAESDKLFIYQGLFSQHRNIELTLETFARCDKSNSIVFMGFGELNSLIEEYARAHENIFVKDAVEPDQILMVTQQADVGLHIPAANSLSYSYSLPNKFFEYLYAGLPVIVSGSLSMQRILAEVEAGIFINKLDIETLYETIFSLDNKNLQRYKKNAINNRHRFEWETNTDVILSCVDEK